MLAYPAGFPAEINHIERSLIADRAWLAIQIRAQVIVDLERVNVGRSRDLQHQVIRARAMYGACRDDEQVAPSRVPGIDVFADLERYMFRLGAGYIVQEILAACA